MRKKICTYSPFNRFVKKRETNPPNAIATTTYKSQLQTEAMGGEFLSSHYLDIYVSRVNPTVRGMDLTPQVLGKPQTKPELLQYNAALASAARSVGDKNLYTSFEKRARQLACELMEDFSMETAVGYYLLSFHLWGESDVRACHYRDITRSLCSRISNNTDIEPNKMFLLELGITGITSFSSFVDPDALGDILTRYQDKISAAARTLIPLVSLLISMQKNLFVDPTGDATWMENVEAASPFRSLDPESFRVHLDQVDTLYNVVMQTELLGEKRISSTAIYCDIHKALLYFASGRYDECFALIHLVLDALEQPFPTFYDPHFIVICHALFMLTMQRRRYTLATRITGLQRKLASNLPGAKNVLEREMDLLRSVDSSLDNEAAHILIPAPKLPYEIEPRHAEDQPCIKQENPPERLSYFPPDPVPHNASPEALFSHDFATDFQSLFTRNAPMMDTNTISSPGVDLVPDQPLSMATDTFLTELFSDM